MAVNIVFNDPELIIALKKKTIFVNPNDLQIFKEIELPQDLEKCGLQSFEDHSDNTAEDESAEDKTSHKKPPREEPTIQNVCLSRNRLLFAIGTSGQKAVLLYSCRPEHAKLLSVRPLSRTSSTMIFSSDSKNLLAVDKTGDCYQYDCVNVNAPPKLLFGHLSIVYGLQWTDDQKFIITSDRDDKIRVTKYPETYNIHGYCLGHTEFVSGLALLEDSTVVSISGDRSARLWDYQSCRQLAKIELPAPGLTMSVRKLDTHHFQLAVLLYQPDECVGLYDIKKSTENWEITENKLLNFSSMTVTNLCFANNRLFVVGNVDEHLVIECAEFGDSKTAPENWLSMIRDQFAADQWKVQDVSMWFKKRYDNVSEYLERKKRRIEEKNGGS